MAFNLWIWNWLVSYSLVFNSLLDVYLKMYQLTPSLAEYLLSHAKDPDIPGLRRDEQKPFIPRNTQSIGIIDPYITMGTDMEYVIEIQYAVENEGQKVYTPDVTGCWLYKQAELKPPYDSILFPRAEIDPYYTGADSLNITDCCVTTPPAIEKLTVIQVQNLDVLLKKEPSLRNCLDSKKQDIPWFQRRF